MLLLAVSRPAERALLGMEPPIDLGTGRLLLLMPSVFDFAEAEAERLTGH